MEWIGRTGNHLRIVLVDPMVPNRDLEAGRVPTPDLQPVESREGLLGGEQDGEAGVTGNRPILS